MKLQNLSYKVLFAIFFFALAGIIFLLKIGNKNITKVSATWWSDSWNYRKSISVTNSSGVGKTNALVKILDNYDISSLVTAGKVQSDLDDLRFVTSDTGTTMSYYITDSTNTSVDIWAIVPSLPTSGTSVWMYYGNASATAVSTTFYTYSASSTFIDGSGVFRLKFLTSGTFVCTTNTIIDAFLVGGGGAGGGTNGYGAGGGGYTNTHSTISITANTNYSIGIGAGGSASAGGTTTAFSYSATGGARGGTYVGGSGGSGGGAGAYVSTNGYSGAGGSDGTNGGNSYNGNTYTTYNGGTGQGTTTREFGETSGDLYAGGGGGRITFTGFSNYTSYSAGGDGGGGTQSSGATNTGGGGSGGNYNGGSGIVVIRYTQPGSTTPSSSEQNKAPPIDNYCLVQESSNDSQLTTTWSDIASDEDGYTIQRSVDGGAWTALSSLAANSTSYNDNTTSSNHTYQYRVAPYYTGSTSYNWCYTTVLNLGQGNFNFEGLNLEGVNLN